MTNDNVIRHCPDINRYETAILRSSGNKKFRIMLSGILRAQRLSYFEEDVHQKCIIDTSVNVIAPAFFFYVWWLIESARAKDCKRLYFLARDGQIFLKIARILQRKLNIDIELKYLYTSRQAWFFPSITSLNANELNWITGYDLAKFVSVKTCFDRIRLQPQNFTKELAEYGLQQDLWQTNLGAKARNNLRECLIKTSLRNKILEAVEDAYELTMCYLQQEGLLDNIDYSLVDIGWNARSQKMLRAMFAKRGLYRKLSGFYFGLSEQRTENVNGYYEHYGFMFDWAKKLEKSSMRNDLVYEILASSNHGRTIGYKRKDNGICPVFDNDHNAAALSWGIDLQHKIITDTCSTLVENFARADFNFDDVRTIIHNILSKFIEKPSRVETEAYGAFLCSSELNENDLQCVAPIINAKDVVNNIVSGTKINGFWENASFIKSGISFLIYVRKCRVWHRLISLKLQQRMKPIFKIVSQPLGWRRFCNPFHLYKHRKLILPSLRAKLYQSAFHLQSFLVRKNIVITENSRKILQYKDKYKGRCFILGSGPSLTISDLDKLKNEFTFACNRIYLAFTETEWRPNFYFIEDKLVFLRDQNQLEKQDFSKSQIFLPKDSLIWGNYISSALYYNLREEHYYPQLAKFGDNPVTRFYWGATVMYTFLQMAFFMGFDEIYILGVDFTWQLPKDGDSNTGKIHSDGQQNHFHKDYRKEGELFHAPKLHMQSNAFTAAREAALKYNKKIYNATRGGKLEIFERIDFDSLFKNED